jgi:hypothetical protein
MSNYNEKGFPLSARGLIDTYYGTQIRLQPFETVLTVGTSSVVAGKLGNQRVAVLYCNPGSTQITLGLSAGVTAGNGYTLGQNGVLRFDWVNDGEMVMQQFYAISSAGGQTLYILESVLSVID